MKTTNRYTQEVREGFLTREDLKAVVAELPDYLRPVTWFAYLTGWRKREVLDLQWNQVDWEGGVIRLKASASKNKKGREFPFRVLPALEELLNSQQEHTRALEKQRGEILPWVFHRDGEHIRSMKTAWNAACRRAGFKGTIFHDLRRCAVMNLERAGVSRSVAMKLTGHKTESVYRRYAIADRAAQEEGVGKLARLFEDKDRKTVVPISKVAEG